MTLMKGKALGTVSFFAGCLLWSPLSNADSLLIRFESGKTQQIILDEPVDAVVSIQAQTTGAESHESANNARIQNLYNKERIRKEPVAAVKQKTPADKKNPHPLKWGAPKIGD
jgi:hypothetical protein